MKKYTKEELEQESIEFLQCPYCGSKLERIKHKDNWILPTSCVRCNHHDLAPNLKKIVFIHQITE